MLKLKTHQRTQLLLGIRCRCSESQDGDLSAKNSRVKISQDGEVKGKDGGGWGMVEWEKEEDVTDSIMTLQSRRTWRGSSQKPL